MTYVEDSAHAWVFWKEELCLWGYVVGRLILLCLSSLTAPAACIFRSHELLFALHPFDGDFCSILFVSSSYVLACCSKMSGLGPTRSCHEVSSIFEEMFYNDGWELRRGECALFFVLHDPNYLCNLRKKVWLQHVDENVLIYMVQAWYWGGLIKNDGSASTLQCLTDFGIITARGRVKNSPSISDEGTPAPTLTQSKSGQLGTAERRRMVKVPTHTVWWSLTASGMRKCSLATSLSLMVCVLRRE